MIFFRSTSHLYNTCTTSKFILGLCYLYTTSPHRPNSATSSPSKYWTCPKVNNVPSVHQDPTRSFVVSTASATSSPSKYWTCPKVNNVPSVHQDPTRSFVVSTAYLQGCWGFYYVCLTLPTFLKMLQELGQVLVWCNWGIRYYLGKAKILHGQS